MKHQTQIILLLILITIAAVPSLRADPINVFLGYTISSEFWDRQDNIWVTTLDMVNSSGDSHSCDMLCSPPPIFPVTQVSLNGTLTICCDLNGNPIVEQIDLGAGGLWLNTFDTPEPITAFFTGTLSRRGFWLTDGGMFTAGSSLVQFWFPIGYDLEAPIYISGAEMLAAEPGSMVLVGSAFFAIGPFVRRRYRSTAPGTPFSATSSRKQQRSSKRVGSA